MHVIQAKESLRAAETAMLPHAPGDERDRVLGQWQGIIEASTLEGDAAELARQGMSVRVWSDEWPDEVVH